jgi:hypothetical protein
MSRRAANLVAALLVLFLAGVVRVRAQDNHESQLKTVRGTVVDSGENPLTSAVVYLKNVKTSAVKTYISDDEGHYRFSGLDPNVDYEVHAEKDDLTSAKRTVSSFDSRKEIVLVLKVSKPKKNGK